jgi:myo-inositol-1-phosphate synthase
MVLDQVLEAGCAFVNAIRCSSPFRNWSKRFIERGLPIIVDELRARLAPHHPPRATSLFVDRGGASTAPTSTTLGQHRLPQHARTRALESKKIPKTGA